jgi:hypothetical protein
MAVTNFSPLLGLALPTTGDLDGTWGTTVNDSITSLTDAAVAGTTVLSVDADVTLSTTNGAANQARQAILRWTASNGATTRNITAPAQSKAYILINAGTGSVVLRAAGPTTGITAAPGETCVVAWNGSDFVKVSSSTAGDVTLNGTQTLTNKTLNGVILNDGYTEEVFAVTGTTPALSPTDGSIQTWTLSANSTPTAGTWAAGQSMTLMIDDGTAFTVTWSSLSVTWKTNGGVAPVLNTTGFTAIVLWKVGAIIYGARVGDA